MICTDDAPSPIQFENLTLYIVGLTRASLDELKDDWIKWLDEHEANIASANLRLIAKADDSVTNLSSIMLLAKADGKTIMFTGDG